MNTSPIIEHLQGLIDGTATGTGTGGTMSPYGVAPGVAATIGGMNRDFGAAAAARAMLDYRMQNRLNESNNAMTQLQLGNQQAAINAGLAQNHFQLSAQDQLRFLGHQQDQRNAALGTISPIIQSMIGEAF